MAEKEILVNLDFNKNSILNVVLQVLASAPGSPVEGQMYYDSTLDRPQWYDGSGWRDLTARANHSGTQLAATISDLPATVQAYSLDLFAPPEADLDANGFKIVGLAAPSAATDAARLIDIQNAVAGLSWKDPVRVATTAAGTLATDFDNGSTIDGVVIATNDRILIKNQAAPAENGIYIVNASGAPTRAADANLDEELQGAAVFVESGTTQADTAWVQTEDSPITVGTDPIVFVQFGAGASITAGDGLTKTGNTLDVGAGTGISVAADTVAVDTAVVTRKFTQNIGDGAEVNFVLTHNFNTRGVAVSVYRNSSPWDEVVPAVEKTSVNTVTVRFNVAPTTDQFTVAIIG